MNIQKIMMGILTSILLSSVVCAVGVTSFYWDGDTPHALRIAPGETKDIVFELQNMVGNDEATFKVEIIQGGAIAKLVNPGMNYTVPAQTKGVPVQVTIKLPKDTEIGSVIKVGASFVLVPKDQSGAFTFNTAFEKYFDVEVVSEELSELAKDRSVKTLPTGTKWLLMGIGIVLLFIVIRWVNNRRKN